MNVEILNKTAEPLMHRIEFKAKVVFEGKTPSRLDLMKDVCGKLSSKPDLTIIKKIVTDYGSERAILNGYVYDSDKEMTHLERNFSKLRHLSRAERKVERDKVKAAKQAVAAAATSAKKKK